MNCRKSIGLMSSIIAALLFAVFAQTPAAAQTGTSVLSLTLDNPFVIGTPGEDVLITGELTNIPTDSNGIGDALSLAGDEIDDVTPNNVTVNDSPYLFGPEFDYLLGTPVTLAPGATTGSIDLFYVDVPANETPGTTITGGFGVDWVDSAGNYWAGDGSTGGPSDLQSFMVNVVPESSGLLLMVFGLATLSVLSLWRVWQHEAKSESDS